MFTPYPRHISPRSFMSFAICSGEAFLFNTSLHTPCKITWLGKVTWFFTKLWIAKSCSCSTVAPGNGLSFEYPFFTHLLNSCIHMPLIMLVSNITVFLPNGTTSLYLAFPGTVGLWSLHMGLLFSGKLLVTTRDLLVFLIIAVCCFNICWFPGFETLVISSSFTKFL